MQAHDQDELRKQAQRVLTRRIGTDPNGAGTPPPEPLPEPPRRRDRAPQQERPPEPPRSRERRQQDFPEIPEVVVVEPRTPEPAPSIPRYDQEPMARTERRPVSSRGDAPQVERSAYTIEPPRHSEIYNALHSRASLRRALIINEVLGKPKALRESTDPENFSGL